MTTPAAKLQRTSTPGIYRRGGRYVVVWRHRGKQHKSFHRTLAEAREAKADRGRRGATRRPQSRRAFDEYARQWVANYQGRTNRGFDEDTRAGYSAALERYAIPHFGLTPLREIERKDMDALITKLQRRGLAAATIEKYIAPVRAMFADATDVGDLQVNPALGLRINRKAMVRNPAASQQHKAMTTTELTAILAAIPEQHRLVFEVMAGTGCRISEALGLDCTDLAQHGDHTTLRIERQWYRGTLKPNTKTEAGVRTMELSPELAGRLWRRCADGTGAMFATRTGGRLSDRNLARVLAKACSAAGVVGVSPHSFRHTHGSILLDQGWPITEVAHRLGHANAAVTAAIYGHKLRDRRRDLSFLDELGSQDGQLFGHTEHPQTAGTDGPSNAVDSAG